MRIGHFACMVALTACGAAGKGPGVPEQKPDARISLDASALSLARVKVPKVGVAPVAVKPQGQSYPLPLAKTAVINLERDVLAKGLLQADSPELQRLLTRGMVIVPRAGRRFDHAYQNLRDRGVPILVSADSVLHQQHIAFNEILKAVELRSLSPMLSALLSGLHRELEAELARDPGSEPALNELALISVARKLLEPSFEPGPAVEKRVLADLDLIEKHQGLAVSSAQSSALCVQTGGMRGRCYREDFSQYVARGHYTVSEELTRYFKAMMWLGRMGRRLKYDDELVQQVLVVQAAKRARTDFDGKQVAVTDLLGRMDQILQYFVGVSDDLTLPEVDGVLRQKLGAGSELALSREALRGLRRELSRLRAPRILSGAVESYGKNADATAKQETQGLRLLGQRFAPDSEMLGRLVFEHTGPDPEHPRFAEVARSAARDNLGDWCDRLDAGLRSTLPTLSRTSSTPDAWRCVCERSITLSDGVNRAEEQDNRSLTQVCRLMPSVLDVAAAMGSPLAERYVAPSRKYAGYDTELARLKASFSQSRESAPDTLYQAWLSTIAPLLQPLPADYPSWMTGTDYQKKSLRTFAASWTELRHDTILYVKQSYTAKRKIRISADETIRLRPPEAYGLVEPRPELYDRLRALAAQTRIFLRTLSSLPPEVAKTLAELEETLERLTTISVQQLEGKGLKGSDEQFIKDIGVTLLRLSSELTSALTPPAPPPSPETDLIPRSETKGLDEVLLVPLVADVHTDLNTERVLEEGTGPLEWMLAVTRLPDGSLSVAVGPVFSFKEFIHPLGDRLTNEKWRGQYKDGAILPDPRWWSEDRPLANGFELPTIGAAPAAK